MNQGKKEKLISAGGTFILIIILVLSLCFFSLSYNRKENNLEAFGIPVMYGNIEDAFGNTDPLGDPQGGYNQESPQANKLSSTYRTNDTEPLTTVHESSPDESMTQDIEETISAPPKSEKEIKEEQETLNLKKEREKKLIQERAEKDRVEKEKIEKERIRKLTAENKAKIDEQMQSLFGSPNGEFGGSRGETQGSGMQGVKTGNASHGATSGIGYNGSYSLEGRILGKGGLIQPRYGVDDYGIVVIDILVNPQGDVLEAVIGKGGNITNSKLINEALKAAKQTKFNEVTSLINQRGTITYKYELN